MGFNYIIFRSPKQHGVIREIPIIYPDILVHSDVAEAMLKVPGMEKFKPISAGSCTLMACSCEGGSSTLKLKSRKGDHNLINNYPYWHGII